MKQTSFGSDELFSTVAGWVVVCLKQQRGGVDAISQPGGRRAVFKHVAEMGVTLCAAGFGACHTVAAVGDAANRRLVDRRPVAGPAATGVEFVLGLKQRRTTTYTAINSRLFVVAVFATEGCLGATFTGHAVLLRAQLLFPVFVIVHGVACGRLGLLSNKLWGFEYTSSAAWHILSRHIP
jgi:hypothetical protein